MNWTGRINRITKVMFPIREGCCLHEKNTLQNLRINKSDRIKREIAGLPVDVQRQIIEDFERKVGIIELRPN